MSAVLNDTDDLLRATELHAHYGQSHVLQGVSLRIARGEAVGLLGRNGMGKTTFIRTLLGQIRATGGRVSMTGKDMTGQPPERIVRLGIGYVPEGRGVFPNLSVRENLVMAARAGTRGQRDWTFERVLETFPRLAERLDHGGGQLSGGEQQMMAIGRALMTNPDLMILDEATEGLAPLVVAEIWRVIGLVRASGIASLVVDRNFKKVLAHTDRCVVLEKGRVVLEGPSAELAADEAALHRYLGV
ncbi:ABC transporter ATP-binding protein [uncultured Azohydromonas sp.]|jgi:ABC-type branched-chain amino acid transport systems, ATPase component|uniref:ABC transporter ATP-binding protein n=1 Tax=uncultured Azohydromonas sp. TaxID=487342 RepID=UPI002604E9FF|nr:ABC transporter ATP-binding protein [uncultured Azohydromonas sp.]